MRQSGIRYRYLVLWCALISDSQYFKPFKSNIANLLVTKKHKQHTTNTKIKKTFITILLINHVLL